MTKMTFKQKNAFFYIRVYAISIMYIYCEINHSLASTPSSKSIHQGEEISINSQNDTGMHGQDLIPVDNGLLEESTSSDDIFSVNSVSSTNFPRHHQVTSRTHTEGQRQHFVFAPEMFSEPPISDILYIYRYNAELGSLATKVKEHCPEWIPCTTHMDTKVDNQICCLSCQCQPRCSVTHKCCPGYEDVIVKSPQTHRYSRTQTCRRNMRFVDRIKASTINNMMEFLVVDSCPINDTNMTQRDDCLLFQDERLENPVVDFKDIIPVTDNSTYTNFANKHCAACHGVLPTNLIYWDVDFRCQLPMPFDIRLVEQEVQYREDCYVVMVPPNDDVANATRCFSDVISSCNVTGSWEEYDHTVEQNCMTVDWLYIDPSSGISRYKNLFCAICNGVDRVPVGNMCPDDYNNFEEVNFFNMVNYDSVSKHDYGATDVTLKQGFVYDPVQRKPRLPVCSTPLLYNVDTLTCVDIYKRVSRWIIQIPFMIHASPPLTMSMFQTVVTDILRTMLNDFYFVSQFVRTNTDFYDISDRESIQEYEIHNIIAMVYKDLFAIEKTTPVRSYNDLMATVQTVNVTRTDINTRIWITYEETDLFYLPDSVNAIPGEVILYKDIRDTTYTVYRDPYTGLAVLRAEEYDVARRFVQKANQIYIFDKTFLKCPTFLYDLTVDGLTRSMNGLKFENSEVEIGFEQFRSRNETHVAICLNAVGQLGLNNKTSTEYLNYVTKLYLLCVVIFQFVF